MSEINPQADLIAALAKIMRAAGSVEKRGRNEFHRYAYATASDVMHKLQPLMAEHGIVILQTEKSRELIMGDAAMAVTYEFTIAHASGAVWPDRPVQTGVAAARTSKGSPDDKCVNKCHTAARKYFLLALFQIPTGDFDEADADGDVPTTGGSRREDAPIQREAHQGSGAAAAHMAAFREKLAECDAESAIRLLWGEYSQARREAGLSQDQCGVLMGEVRAAIDAVNAPQLEAAE